MARYRRRNSWIPSANKPPYWLRNIGKVLKTFLSEEQTDSLEEPSLYRRIEDAYRRNFEVSNVNWSSSNRRKWPPPSGENSSESQNVEEQNNVNFNHAKNVERPYTVKLRESINQVKPDGDEGEKEENLIDFEKMEMESQVQEVLGELEKPTFCLKMMSKLGKFCDDNCCNYTTRIYFKKPLTWYSATAKLDAGTMLRENYIGITAGILIGYISYLVFASAFAHAPHIATLAACYMMMFALFGITFSADFRCVLINTLPYIVASRTRWMLMMIATTLVTTGPAINFMHNSGNFRNAIACVLGQVNANAELVAKIISAPLQIIRKNLKDAVDKINGQLFQVRSMLKELREAFRLTTNLFDGKSSWIKSVVEACGDEIAMKNQCLAFFNQLYFNCAATMQSLSFLCNFMRMFASQACKSVSVLNDICEKYANKLRSEIVAFSPVSEAELDESEDTIKSYLGKENISVDIDEDATDLGLSSNFSAQTQVTAMIEERMDDMMNVMNTFKYFMQWLLVIWTLLTVIQLILQSAMYRRKWIKKPHFDNTYITSQFVAQERKAVENGRPTALPLTYFEKRRYITLTACKWSAAERKSASKSVIFIILGMSALVLMIIADYAMYYVVITAAPAFSSDFGGLTKTVDEGASNKGGGTKEEVTPQIDGNSSMADMSRSFLQLANPLKDVAFSVDASICRPRASEPDHHKATLIICVLAFTLISIVVQVYVLRLRHLIMAWYYPTAAVRRAAWLRTYIRNNRGLFFRLVHRLHLKNVKSMGIKWQKEMNFVDRFIFFNPKLAKYLKLVGFSRVFCAQCSAPGNPAKKDVFQENFTQCPRCGMFYCKLCQADLKGICMDCNVPLRTKSVEVDFEVWSSDEEYDYFYNRYFTRRKHDAYEIPKCPPSLMKTLKPQPALPAMMVAPPVQNIEVRPDLAEKLRIIAERRRVVNRQGDIPEKEKPIPPRLIIHKKMPVSSTTETKWQMTTSASTTETVDHKAVEQSVVGLNEEPKPDKGNGHEVKRDTESESQTYSNTEETYSEEGSEILTTMSSITKRDKKKHETKLLGDCSISEPVELSSDIIFETSFSPPGEMNKESEALNAASQFSSLSIDFSDIKPFSLTNDSQSYADFSSMGGLSSLNCLHPTMSKDRKQRLESVSLNKYGSNKSNAHCEITQSTSLSTTALNNESPKTSAKITPGGRISTINNGTNAVEGGYVSQAEEEGVSLSSQDAKTQDPKESSLRKLSQNKSPALLKITGGAWKASERLYLTNFEAPASFEENNCHRSSTTGEPVHFGKTNRRVLKDMDGSLLLDLLPNLFARLPPLNEECNTATSTVIIIDPPSLCVRSDNSDLNQNSDIMGRNFDKVRIGNEDETARNLPDPKGTEVTPHNKRDLKARGFNGSDFTRIISGIQNNENLPLPGFLSEYEDKIAKTTKSQPDSTASLNFSERNNNVSEGYSPIGSKNSSDSSKVKEASLVSMLQRKQKNEFSLSDIDEISCWKEKSDNRSGNSACLHTSDL